MAYTELVLTRFRTLKTDNTGELSMTTKSFASVTVLGLLTGLMNPSPLNAQVITTGRCATAFGVSPQVAQNRYAWALHCRANPGNSPVGGLRDPNHYLSTYSIADYSLASTDMKSRLYPTYLNYTSAAFWDLPNSPGTDCGVLPPDIVNVGLCVAGCYTGETVLRFADGETDIKSAAATGKIDLVTLSSESTLGDIKTITNRVQNYTVDITEAWQTIYTITMKSGGVLRVTSEHPLVTDKGVIRQAKSLKPGIRLLRADGSPDPIDNVSISTIYGKVYNVNPTTLDYTSNIVIAGGYLNGSTRYQNEFLSTINAVILRRSLARMAN